MTNAQSFLGAGPTKCSTVQYMRVLTLAVVMFGLLTSARAGDPLLRSSIPLSDHDVLILFCKDGKLFDRGVTNSPFAGPMDRWIVQLVAGDLNFGRFLEITDEQRALAKRERHVIGDEEPEAAFGAMTEQDENFLDTDRGGRVVMEKILSADQRKKLPAIFVALEGLMALRRAEFQTLIGMTPQKQAEIAALTDKCWDEQALPLHRGVFSTPANSMDQLPELNLLLRAASSDLDTKIAESLGEDQRARLSPILRQAYEIQKLVTGPGCR